MKTITIQGKTYQYQVFIEYHEYGTSEWTEFYDGFTSHTKTYKRFWLFGETLSKTITDHNLVFKVNCNIEDKYLTKEQVRDRIQKQLDFSTRELDTVEKNKQD